MARGKDQCSTNNDGFHNAADAKPNDGGRRGGGRARTRRWTAVLGCGVDNHDGVGCNFWVVPLNPVFVRLVKVVLRRFFNNYRLGKRRRLRLRMWRRGVEESFRGRTLDRADAEEQRGSPGGRCLSCRDRKQIWMSPNDELY